MDRKTSVSQPAAGNDLPDAEWIDAKEAARLLEWENENSVRNAKDRGAFGPRGKGWIKLKSRQIRYSRGAVEAYSRRIVGEAAPARATS